MFERAVELDPEFTKAYTELSLAHSHLYHLGFDRSDARQDSAKAVVEQAQRLEPDLPAINMAHGYYYYYYVERDYEQALSFAVRSYDIGPRVGELCARNWRTMSLAQERLGDDVAAGRAVQRAEQCMVTRPTGL
jgi:tetratricopeptide (TPR) repeat protein